MKILKKITAALLFLALVAAFAGCENTPPVDTTPMETTPAETTPTETTPAESTPAEYIGEGRQSIVTHDFLKVCFNERALELLYDSPYLKEYLDNGYTLTSIIESADNNSSTVRYAVTGNQLSGTKTKDCEWFRCFTPYGSLEINNYGDITVESRLVTLAENKQTGDKKIIVFSPILVSLTKEAGIYKQVNTFIKGYSFVDTEEFHNSLSVNEDLIYYGEINITGADVYNNQFYQLFENIFSNSPYDRIQPISIEFTDIYDIEPDNAQQQEWLNQIADINNQNILVKTPD